MISISIQTQLNLTTMFYFIRHGQSDFNVFRNKMRSKYLQQYYLQEEWVKQRFHQKYIDSPLSQNGVKQAEQCRKKMENQIIDVVVVSPLRRTLQTCNIVFKDHKSKPQIIVDPRARDYIQSSCDIGASLSDLMKQFSHFNFKKITDPQAWYLHSIHDQQKRDDAFRKLEGLSGVQRNQIAKKHGIQYIIWLHSILWNDLALQKKLKQKKLSQLGYFLEQYAEKYKDKNIAIVSHSENIKAYLKITPDNCEIIPVKVQEIQIKVKQMA